jgi:hypothetical protein
MIQEVSAKTESVNQAVDSGLLYNLNTVAKNHITVFYSSVSGNIIVSS